MSFLKTAFFLIFIIFCRAIFAQSFIHVPDSISQNVNDEINFISKKINSNQEGIASTVKLKCYLSSLYNKAGKYQQAVDLIDGLSKEEFSVAPGDVSLAKAINFKYQLEPEKAKYLFDRALLEFTLNKNSCKLIETHIELIEYYRKFDLKDLAFAEAQKTERLLQENIACGSVLQIRYLNRLAAIQNFTPHRRCIETSYQCIDSCLKYDEVYYLAVSYNEIGFAYQHILSLDSADYFYKLSEDLFMAQSLFADALHVKMNRLRMYAHHRINSDELIPGLLEIESEAIKNCPEYDLVECYRSIWVESMYLKDWEVAFNYHSKFHDLEIEKMYQNIEEKIAKVKQQEKESKTKIENFILSSQVEKQNNQLEQSRNTLWLVVLALIVLMFILIFVFRILRQRNKLTKDLEQRNQQKDELIQEVHHRVKNNLSFVSSLLEMQINSLPEETKTEELKNASLRIESMSLVHQMLYNQDDIAMVDLKRYIPELLSNLKDSMTHADQILVDFECDEIKVESRTATAFGLIITEFVTNSFKHAFKGIKHPKIEICLQRKNSELYLVLKDNGVGMNTEMKASKKGFGMRIIDIFSRQINAELNFSFNQGTQLTLMMKYEA